MDNNSPSPQLSPSRLKHVPANKPGLADWWQDVKRGWRSLRKQSTAGSQVLYAELRKKHRLPNFLESMFTDVTNWLRGYWKYLQVFTISIFFYLIVFFIVTKVFPRTLANIPLADTYLLFQLPLFFGNFFFGTFLLQSKRLGLWLSTTIFIILFFKLGAFTFNAGLIIFITLVSVGTLFILIGKKVWSKLNR